MKTTLEGSIKAENRSETPADRAAKAVDWLKERAKDIDREGKLTPEVWEKLNELGLWGITQPKRYGGQGLGLEEAWKAAFTIAEGCPSTAWVLSLCAANTAMVGKFSEKAQDEVFEGGATPAISVLTGLAGREVNTEPAEEGFMLSGIWSYASGIDVAGWVGLLVDRPSLKGGNEQVIALIPAKEFEINHDSWNVTGMRGTGSKTITLPKVFVPEYRCLSLEVMQNGGKHPDCPNTEIEYDFPLMPVFAMSLVAPVLGTAGAVIEEFRTLAKRRIDPASRQPQREVPSTQNELGLAAARISMLQETLLNETRRLTTQVTNKDTLPLIERAELRVKLALMSRDALGTSQRLFSAAGGSLLPSGSPLERLFRDLHAMSTHYRLQPEHISEIYGKLLLDVPIPEDARI